MAYKILIVCTGNTCRSPMGEGILKRMVSEIGIQNVYVASAGIGAFPGLPASKEAIIAMKELGIDIRNHKSATVNTELVRSANLILAMERFHLEEILRIEPSAKDKTYLLGQFGPKDKPLEVEDPVGMPTEVFRRVAARIFECLKGVIMNLDKLKEQNISMSGGPKIIAIGCDHRGVRLKDILKRNLTAEGYQIIDCGTTGGTKVDYPDYAFAVAERVVNKECSVGILICSSGIGMSIAANKVKGIRAALCLEPRAAEVSRKHNDANILVLGADFIDDDAALDITIRWLNTPFENERHTKRLKKIQEYENANF